MTARAIKRASVLRPRDHNRARDAAAKNDTATDVGDRCQATALPWQQTGDRLHSVWAEQLPEVCWVGGDSGSLGRRLVHGVVIDGQRRRQSATGLDETLRDSCLAGPRSRGSQICTH